MAYAINSKCIISGKYREFYKYNSPVWYEYKRQPRLFKKQKIQMNIFEKPISKKTKFSIMRARTEVRRIIQSNANLNRFLTLTFDPKKIPNCHDVSAMNKLFKNFTERLKYQYNHLKYIAVIEFQKNTDHRGVKKINGGAVHYHLLCHLPYVPSKKIRKIWKNGYIKINRIDQVDNLGIYVAKYLGKGDEPTRLFNKKKYFKSQNLKSPIELLGYRAEKLYEDFYQNKIPDYEKVFSNEYRGDVDYKSFTATDNNDLLTCMRKDTVSNL